MPDYKVEFIPRAREIGEQQDEDFKKETVRVIVLKKKSPTPPVSSVPMGEIVNLESAAPLTNPPVMNGNIENEPIYVQLVHYINQLGELRIMEDTLEAKPRTLQFSDRKWRFLTDQELHTYCKDFLRKFFNNVTLDKVKDCDNINLDPLNAKVSVTINKDAIKRASYGGFTLTKEIKELINEIYDTKDMYRSEKYFLAPPNILPFKNGYLDLETGSFNYYNEREYKGFLYCLDANYLGSDGAAELPTEFSDMLSDAILNPGLHQWENDARYKSMISCIAYSFIPTNHLRKLFIIIGPTACGKSVFAGIMRAVFGDLGVHLQSYSIMKKNRNDDELRPDLRSAVDKLWVDISETDEKQTVDAVTIKSYTGNDPITFRKRNSDKRITKLMNCKIWMMTNTFPKITNYKDNALQDRVVIFDWYNSIQEEKRNPELKNILTTDDNRDIIGTYFANKAITLYHETDMHVNPSFLFNIYKYFDYQNDPVALFYDSLPKHDVDCKPDWINSIKTVDLAFAYQLFLQGLLGHNVNLTNSERRAFENRFAEIASSDHYYFVKRHKNTSGHFYSGILVLAFSQMYPISQPPFLNAGFNPALQQIQYGPDTEYEEGGFGLPAHQRQDGQL